MQVVKCSLRRVRSALRCSSIHQRDCKFWGNKRNATGVEKRYLSVGCVLPSVARFVEGR